MNLQETNRGVNVSSLDPTQVDDRCITTVRLLSLDAVKKANSGHPGLPMDAVSLA